LTLSVLWRFHEPIILPGDAGRDEAARKERHVTQIIVFSGSG
jgi:hypothetical protein